MDTYALKYKIYIQNFNKQLVRNNSSDNSDNIDNNNNNKIIIIKSY